MRKKSASGVLASLRGSTYDSPVAFLKSNGSPVRFASSLAAALLDGLFAHPAWLFSVVSNLNICDGY
jgi:hypothetical protein